ncbi:hypothetical protein A1F94_004274 [Pyrenophora tritici-repentis]|nr:hypothetical protein A1F94_004274 [Pyrenophora tritici-repentis]
MFDKLRGKSPSGHSKQDSTTSTTSFSRPTPPPAYTSPSQTTFASLSLHMEDRLRFLRFPAPILTTCTATILAHWPPGIQQERPYATSHEIKLNGYPLARLRPRSSTSPSSNESTTIDPTFQRLDPNTQH